MKIFVTVGTTLPFDRLIKKIDEIAKDTKFQINVQMGNSSYSCSNLSKVWKMLSVVDLSAEINAADVVVMHAGIGTIIDLVKIDKPCILVPRLQKFNEAVDDHQLQICRELEKQGAGVCYEMNQLKSSLHDAKSLFNLKGNEYNKLEMNINNYLNR